MFSVDWRRETLGTEKPVPKPVQDPSVGVQRAWTWVLVLGAEKKGRIWRRSGR